MHKLMNKASMVEEGKHRLHIATFLCMFSMEFKLSLRDSVQKCVRKIQLDPLTTRCVCLCVLNIVFNNTHASKCVHMLFWVKLSVISETFVIEFAIDTLNSIHVLLCLFIYFGGTFY